MKLRRFHSRLGTGLLILLALVFASVVWAEDVGTRLRCTVTDQTKAFVGQAQLTSRKPNNTFSAAGASSDQGEYTFIKRSQVREGHSLQFRSEFFNLLNRTNFASPIQKINNPNFGISNSQMLINNTQSRQVQFGLKLEF